MHHSLMRAARLVAIPVVLNLLGAAGASAQDKAPAPVPPAKSAAATMQAIQVHQYGPPSELKLEEVPRPVPGDDEMLIRVHAAAVNPVDDKIRSGQIGRMFKTPFIPGFDASGTVEQVGKNIKKFKPGDAVFTYVSLQHGGCYAQYMTAGEAETAPKPAKLTFEEAAAVPLAALTAWQALLDTAKLEAGQTVLIHGGSGGVGAFAVQIAKTKGARVIATASADNQQFLKDLGADVAIDYKAAKFEEIAKEVDVVLDTVGGDTQARSWSTLKKGGILVSIVQPPDQAKAAAAGARGSIILVKPNAAELAEIGGLIDAGKIKVTVSQVFPLADAAKAHEQIATKHTRGKIVLKMLD